MFNLNFYNVLKHFGSQKSKQFCKDIFAIPNKYLSYEVNLKKILLYLYI